jgi:transcriptional regulator with XRE-family HTH domain
MNINEMIEEFDKQYPEVIEQLKKDIAYQTGQMILDARLKSGMTQVELAERMQTKQPAIARLETGASFPSLRMLDRMAKDVFHTYLLPPRFASFAEKENIRISTNSSGFTSVASFGGFGNNVVNILLKTN